MEDKQVKILFQFYSELLEKNIVETVWAKELNKEEGFYQIDSIPFYVPNIASDDIVLAKLDKENNQLVFIEAIEYSGNSVIRIFVKGKNEINLIRDKFKKMNCTSERNGDNYFVMEIPKNVDYSIVKKELNNLEDKGILAYAEAVLSDEHK